MKALKNVERLASVAFAVLAMVLAVHATVEARGTESHGFGGGHPSGGVHHGFDGQHHDFDRHGHDRFFFGPAFPYYGYYGYPAPAYWYYYCLSYGAYYPNVTSCPEEWVPVPAS